MRRVEKSSSMLRLSQASRRRSCSAGVLVDIRHRASELQVESYYRRYLRGMEFENAPESEPNGIYSETFR